MSRRKERIVSSIGKEGVEEKRIDRKEVKESEKQGESHMDSEEVEKSSGDREGLITPVISCDRTLEAADIHPPPGRS